MYIAECQITENADLSLTYLTLNNDNQNNIESGGNHHSDCCSCSLPDAVHLTSNREKWNGMVV